MEYHVSSYIGKYFPNSTATSNGQMIFHTARKVATVPQPNLTAAYDSNMGGVNMLDNSIAKYRIAVKRKK
jgi:hypothetical protein